MQTRLVYVSIGNKKYWFEGRDFVVKCFLKLNPLSPRGCPKDPQLSKSLNALKKVFKSGQNVLDFSNDDFRKIFDQIF